MEDNILIRIAWYDKQINKYDYGNWHHFSKIDYKKKWVEEQNKKYQYVRYWVEGCITSNKNEKIGKNIETFNFIKIESQKENEFILL